MSEKPPTKNAADLGTAAAELANAGVRLLDLLAPEDAARARAALAAAAGAFHRNVPGGAVEAMQSGDVVTALLMTVLERRRRRGEK